MNNQESYTPRNPDFHAYILKKIEGQHFMRLVGFEIDRIEAGRVEGHMKIDLKHKQQHGFLHGGVTATLLDIVMGFSAYSLVDKNQGVVTANLDVDFLHPGVGEEVIARGRVDKIGSKLAYCSADLFVRSGDEEMLVAKGKSLMAIIQGG